MSQRVIHNRPVIWIDIENAPHVWVMSPIVDFLRSKGYEVVLTCRNFSYTMRLCSLLGYEAEVVGFRGGGRNIFTKAFRLLSRAFLLCWKIRGMGCSLALSHGSRSQVLAAKLFKIPIICLDDYEFSNQTLVRFMDYLLVPFPISEKVWDGYSKKVVHYPGLKEEIYLCRFDRSHAVNEPGDSQFIKILFRPEGITHYVPGKDDIMHMSILEYLAGSGKKLFLTLLPRYERQEELLKEFCERYLIKYRIPSRVLEGPSLISGMDLVVGGGGTMTREAAVLGVPSYSFFRGRWGAVDIHLKKQQKLIQIASIKDISKIIIEKRKKLKLHISTDALVFVCGFIEKQLYFSEPVFRSGTKR